MGGLLSCQQFLPGCLCLPGTPSHVGCQEQCGDTWPLHSCHGDGLELPCSQLWLTKTIIIKRRASAWTSKHTTMLLHIWDINCKCTLRKTLWSPKDIMQYTAEKTYDLKSWCEWLVDGGGLYHPFYSPSWEAKVGHHLAFPVLAEDASQTQWTLLHKYSMYIWLINHI